MSIPGDQSALTFYPGMAGPSAGISHQTFPVQREGGCKEIPSSPTTHTKEIYKSLKAEGMYCSQVNRDTVLTSETRKDHKEPFLENILPEHGHHQEGCVYTLGVAWPQRSKVK